MIKSFYILWYFVLTIVLAIISAIFGLLNKLKLLSPVTTKTLMVHALSLYGPVGAKTAQYLAMRSDLFSAESIALMRKYQSQAHSLNRSVYQILSERLMNWHDNIWTVKDPNIGSGSLCQVALINDKDGNLVCAKFLKPKVDAQLHAIIWIVSKLVALLTWLGVPPRMPADKIWHNIRRTLEEQFDLNREHQNTQAALEQFAKSDDIIIPQTWIFGNRTDIMLVQYLNSLKPIDQISGDVSCTLNTLTRAVYKMIFQTGLVHIDLHPGNVFWHSKLSKIALLDFGMCTRLTRDTRQDFEKFFAALVFNRGAEAADVVVKMADQVPNDFNEQGFKADIIQFISQNNAKLAGEFRVAEFVRELLGIQKKYFVIGNSDIVAALFALVHLENIILALDPSFNFQKIAQEFMHQRIAVN